MGGYFSQRYSRIIFLVAILLSQLGIFHSEIIELDMILDASSIEVHFVRGYLQAPASVDLSFVKLITNEEPVYTYGDDEYKFYEDDEYDDYSTSSPSHSSSSNDDVSNPVGGDDNPDEGDDADGSDDGKSADEDSSGLDTNGGEINEEGNNDEKHEQEKDSVDSPNHINEDKDIVNNREKHDGDAVGNVGNNTNEDINTNEEDVDENTKQEIDSVDSPHPINNNNNNNDSDSVNGNNNGEENNSDKNEKQDNVDAKNENEKGTEKESNPRETPTDKGGAPQINEGSTKNNMVVNKDDETEYTPMDTRNNTRPEEQDEDSERTNDNDGIKKQGDQADKTNTDNEIQTTTEATFSPTPDDQGGRSRVLDNEHDGTTFSAKQVMDITLFLVPGDCKKDIWGSCDWVTLGLGVYDDEMEGGMSYCCSKDTAERGICDSSEIGTLIHDHSIFTGFHRQIDVPTEPLQDFSLDDPKFEVEVSGDYVMVIANCNDDGLSIITLGSMEWKSVGGYLPGDIFGLMFFYAGLAAIYFVLTFWYYCGMKMYQESAIPIQKFILATMCLGLLEVSFLGIDLFIWNTSGYRSPLVAYTGLGLGVLKRGSSRCLGVMVAMGWGVVRDSLGTTLIKIIFLGLLYSCLTLAREFLEIFAEAVQKKSLQQQEELLDLALVLTPIIFVVNAIFYCWIISSLSSTTEYLRNMNQASKLRRHMRLRCLIITSLVIVGIVMALSIAQIFTNYLSKDQLWIIQAVTHANYLFILFGVGILWKPNSNAKDYAMQMEVPALGEGENELELSCVVPSAEDVDNENGFKINDAVAT